MREIKINDSMEIHYSTKTEDYSFAHGHGLMKQQMEVVHSFDVWVKTHGDDWVSIKHAIPESFYGWCFELCENHLMKTSEVA